MLQFLHTRIRVSDLERTIAFYQKLGFELTKRMISPQGNQLAYVGIPGSKHLLELCWSADYTVQVPEDLMHTAIGVDDIMASCADLESHGIAIWPEDWKSALPAVPEGKSKIAFVTDPDGYEVELIENH